MSKTLYDIMDTSDDCVEDFKKACGDVIDAKYILAEKKISVLLQTIARSRRLYDLFGACMQSFDFGAELLKAKTPTGLVLPAERKKQIAFVFCLLLSFDTNQTDFKKFLHTFYGDEQSPNTEFSDFAKAVMAPFRDNVIAAYFKEADEPKKPAQVPYSQSEPLFSAVQQQPAASVSSPFIESAPAYKGNVVSVPINGKQGLDELAVESLSGAVREIIGIVARDSTITTKEKEELLLVCEAFDEAVRQGADKPMKTMFIGLKHTVAASSLKRGLEIQLEGLERLITEYDLD
jgi:hypothetical protein